MARKGHICEDPFAYVSNSSKGGKLHNIKRIVKAHYLALAATGFTVPRCYLDCNRGPIFLSCHIRHCIGHDPSPWSDYFNSCRGLS